MRLRTRVVLGALLGFTGCGGSETPPDRSAPPTESAPSQPAAGSQACTLLTAEEIGGVMGASPGAPQAGQTQVCTWPSSSGSGPLVLVELTESGFSTLEAFVSSYQTEFGGEEPPPERFRPIDGLGDWAMYVVDDGQLQIHRAGRMLIIATTPAGEEQAVALGQKAIVRLP